MKEYYILYHKKKPWAQKFFSARNRCNNKNNSNYYLYGGKGIKCRLTLEETEYIWKRDNANILKIPSLDRINSAKDYTLKNCRFIEYKQNSLQGAKQAGINLSKPVDQYTLTKKYVKTHKSIGDAAKSIGNYSYKYSIASCCRKEIYDGKRKLTCQGFIWRFKGESPEW